MTFAFDNTYARLPERFFSRVAPTAVRILAGNAVPDGASRSRWPTPATSSASSSRSSATAAPSSSARSSARRRAPRHPAQGLGAHAVLARRRRPRRPRPGAARIHRQRGDGALGVPTTRSLAAVDDRRVGPRETMLPGAVLVRVAASHIRVGTFQCSPRAATGRPAQLTTTRSPATTRTGSARRAARRSPARAGHRGAGRTGRALARWLGFIHGVMNTDNTAISGETIDYGPCAFLDAYDPGKTFSSIDAAAATPSPTSRASRCGTSPARRDAAAALVDADPDQGRRPRHRAPRGLRALFAAAHDRVQRAKLGLSHAREPDDAALLADLYARMAANEVDYTLFFRRLCESAADPAHDAETASGFATPAAFHEWATRWRQRLQREPGAPAERRTAMRGVNPAFIPRNHRIEEVIAAAAERNDLAPFETLTRVLEHPYDDQPAHAALRAPPSRDERVQATFCGT
jgi:uncharacterized protein YdiU (UPF0061 family)